MLFTTFLFATIILVIFTFLPIWRFEAWWVRSLDFPRLQLFLISLLLILMESVMLDLSQPSTWVLLILALFCFVYHAWWIVPYTRVFPVEVKSAIDTDRQRIIRIMTANVLTPNRNAKGLIELVRENGPDIIVTLESDEWWQVRLDILEPGYHLFHSAHFTLSKICRLPGFGSDHFALLTELVFEDWRNVHQKGLDADTEDLSWAKAKTDDQDVSKKDVPQPGTT